MIMSYKRKICYLILMEIYQILQKSDNSFWAQKHDIGYPEWLFLKRKIKLDFEKNHIQP